MKKISVFICIMLMAVFMCACGGTVPQNTPPPPPGPGQNNNTDGDNTGGDNTGGNTDGDNTGGDNTGGTVTVQKPLSFGANLLKNCSADIDDNAESFAVELKTTEFVNVNNKGYLVYFDGNNTLHQVSFVYEYTKTVTTTQGEEVVSEEVTITQEEIKAQISDLYVTKTFTYISFIPLDYTENSYYFAQNRFTANASFTCDSNHQSFIMDNSSHKLYPTNQIGTFTNITENYVTVDGKYYELSVGADNTLSARKLIQNDNISVSKLLVDKYGNVFVKNSAENRIVGNYFYYTGAAFECYLGNDGVVYSFEKTDYYGQYNIRYDQYDIKYFNENLQHNFVPNSIKVRFDRYLVRDNYLYFLSSSYSDFYSWLYHIPVSNGIAIDDYNDTYTYISENKYFLAGTDIYMHKIADGNKTLYSFNTPSNTTGQAIDTFTEIKISGSRVLLTREVLEGTKIFEVYKNANGDIVNNMLVDIEYQNTIITIQPLN